MNSNLIRSRLFTRHDKYETTRQFVKKNPTSFLEVSFQGKHAHFFMLDSEILEII